MSVKEIEQRMDLDAKRWNRRRRERFLKQLQAIRAERAICVLHPPSQFRLIEEYAKYYTWELAV